MELNQINILALAYLGDSVYELKIRKHFIESGVQKVNNLQKKALSYVSAKNQCKYINYLIDNNILSEEELDYVKRGRNAKVFSHPKNTPILTYKWATALECLFGYLYLKQDFDRINYLIKVIVGEDK